MHWGFSTNFVGAVKLPTLNYFMNFLSVFHSALLILTRNKVESLLMLLNLTVAFATTTFAITLVQRDLGFIQSYLNSPEVLTIEVMSRSQIEPSTGVAKGEFSVKRTTSSELNKNFSLEDLSFILELTPSIEYSYAQVMYGVEPEDHNIPKGIVDVLAVTPGFFESHKTKVLVGSLFTMSDVDANRPVALISQSFAEMLNIANFSKNVDLALNGEQIFNIIGIVEDAPTGPFNSTYYDVIIPFTTAATPFAKLESLYYVARDSHLLPAAKSELETIAKKQWGETIGLRTAEHKLIVIENSRSASLMIAVLASILLVMGGVNVMNSMLGGVLQGDYNIGIARSLGASRQDIFSVFLTRSTVLSVGAIILGILLSLGLILLANRYFLLLNYSYLLYPSILSLSTGTFLCLILGTAFGVYPSFIASRVNPVVLRRL